MSQQLTRHRSGGTRKARPSRKLQERPTQEEAGAQAVEVGRGGEVEEKTRLEGDQHRMID